MTFKVLFPTLALASAVLALAACDKAKPAGPVAPLVTVSNAVCRPTPNGRDTTACYLKLISTTDDRLVAVSSDIGMAQMHSSSMSGGVMAMAPMTDGLALPAGQSVGFVTGGDHIMMTGVAKPLATGDTVKLTLAA